MKSAKDFFDYDFLSTLFPMETCRFLIGHGAVEIDAHIQRCLSDQDGDSSYQFLAQTRVYASKPHHHVRRTVKLDPVAEYFLYEIIFRNKSKFRKPFTENKKHFGYRFDEGKPIPATSSYTGFKKALVAYGETYSHSLSFDVASYFNNIYHHDIVSWFANLGANLDDVNALGTYLRQSNSGRSIDCWPQGLYPAKMVGNDFLRFVEQHHGIKSNAIVRFMDDFVMYSDNPEALTEDFYRIQKLLGQKGLSVNPSKTEVGGTAGVKVEKTIDAVKATLLAKRRKASLLAYMDDFESALEEIKMTKEELEYLRELLKAQHLEEEDAELALSLFRDNPIEVQPHLEQFLVNFPHLAKNIWSLCKHI